MKDWVDDLYIAEDVKQMIVVLAEGSRADISLHEKDEQGKWMQILETDGFVGKNGIGKTKEGEDKTPVGVYHFTHAFGILEDPGCAIPYLKVDDSYYWVDDAQSSYYNKFVSKRDVTCDWKSAEHIVEVGKAYHYVLALDYNPDCIPGAGSAIFFHCETGRPTAGCVTVPENVMVQILKRIQKDCIIMIDAKEKLKHI